MVSCVLVDQWVPVRVLLSAQSQRAVSAADLQLLPAGGGSGAAGSGRMTHTFWGPCQSQSGDAGAEVLREPGAGLSVGALIHSFIHSLIR